MIRNLIVIGVNEEASRDIIEELNTLEGYSVSFLAEEDVDVSVETECCYIVDLSAGAFEIVRFLNMAECHYIFVNIRNIDKGVQKETLRKVLDYKVIDCFLPPFCAEQFLLKKKMTHSTEQVLKEQVLKKMGTMAVITDRNYKILYVNDALCEESGYSREELLGKDLSMFRTDTHSVMLYNNIKYTIESGMHWHGALKNKRKDHSVYWENANIFSIAIDDEMYYCKSAINITQNEMIATENKRAEKMAIAIQNAMLPPDMFKDNIIIRSIFKPLEAVSGDIYCWFDLGDGKYAVFLADVIGHGIGSALITTSIIATVRGLVYESPEPDRMLYHLNDSIIDLYKLNELNQTSYFSASYLIIDTNKRKIHHANCGHPKVYVMSDEEVGESQTPNFLIGLFKNSEFEFRSFNYNPGTELLLYSDGLIEMDQNDLKAGSRMLEKKLLEYVREGYGNNLINYIEERILMNSDEFNDDITVVTIALP